MLHCGGGEGEGVRELLRMCRDFMRENAREWSEQRDLEEKRKGEEERKVTGWRNAIEKRRNCRRKL